MNAGLRLGVALAGLDAGSIGVAGARGAIEWAARRGFAAVQLNGAEPGMRPRELGRSARRDLGAMMRRVGLECAGIDLWIPPEHFEAPATVDRAVSAVGEALDLAADLVRLGAAGRDGCAVSIALPRGGGDAAAAEIAGRAERVGAWAADHAWPPRDGPAVGPSGAGGLAVGIDPAAALAAGGDPVAAVVGLGGRLVAARVSDVSRLGGRVAAGSRDGQLDLAGYKIALVASGFLERGRLPVLDLRGMGDQDRQAGEALERWNEVPG
jgi:sugar phosphate isomerase/epimerase